MLFMTRNGRKQPRRAMASAYPLTTPLEGQNGTVRCLPGREHQGPMKTDLVAEADAQRAGGVNESPVQWHRPQSSGRFGQRHAVHKDPVVRDHPAKAAFGDQFHGLGAEQGAKHTVHERRAAPALQMTEHHQARFLARALLDFPRHDRANAAQPGLAILLRAADGDKIAARRPRAFGETV